MSTVTLSMPEDKAEQLARAAEQLGVTVDELLQRITDEFLSRRTGFAAASDYVLQKNAELYRRLAK